MKKFTLAIATLCYFVVTCGVMVNTHYCMNRLASVKFFEAHNDTCGRCGMDTHESNGCCRDEVSLVKMQDDQNKLVIASFDIPALDPIVITPSGYISIPFYNAGGQRHFLNHSPPLLSQQDTYLQNNVFRI